MKSNLGQMHDLVAFQATSMIEVELLDAFAGRVPGSPDPAFAAVSVPGSDLTLQTSRQVFLVAPRFRAGPLGEPVGGKRAPVQRGAAAAASAVGWRGPAGRGGLGDVADVGGDPPVPAAPGQSMTWSSWMP
jgi:hypothetical protein